MSIEEREALIEAIIEMLNEANEYELRCVYVMLLNMK